MLAKKILSRRDRKKPGLIFENMGQIETAMHESLMVARRAWRVISKNDLETAAKIIKTIVSIKYQMENLAVRRGYSQACKQSIASCCGVCCKWHFPKNLTPIDFFLALHGMSAENQHKLSELIAANRKHQCPALQKMGCFFSFKQRPVVCTNAYPCFNDRSYWKEKEAKAGLIKKAFVDLAAVIQIKN